MMRLGFFLFIFFFVSRAFIYFIVGVSPNINVITRHWQNLDIAALNENLFSQIANLHSQAPLWNLLLGFSAKLCSADVFCTASFLHVFFISMTFFICMMMIGLLIDLGASRMQAFLASAAFSVLPATVYYENYPFYPQLIMFLCSLSAYYLFKWIKYKDTKYQILFMASMACLSWTWGLFHPALISLVLVFAMIALRVFDLRSLAVAATAILLAFSPSLKNYYMHGFFGSSSWLGLNLSQVAPSMPQRCSFGAHRQDLSQIAHPGTAFNDISIIQRSQECQDLAISNILASPFEYIRGRVKATVISTIKTPSDYFFPPNGFSSYPRFSGYTGLVGEAGAIDYQSALRGVLVFSSNIFTFFALLYFCLNGDRPSKSVALLGLIFFAFVFVIGHAANGGEQERFRHSVTPFLFVTTMCLISRMIQKLREHKA